MEKACKPLKRTVPTAAAVPWASCSSCTQRRANKITAVLRRTTTDGELHQNFPSVSKFHKNWWDIKQAGKKYTSRTWEFKVQQSKCLGSEGDWRFSSPLQNRWKPKWKEGTQNHWKHVGVHWAASRQFWTQAVQQWLSTTLQFVPRTPQNVIFDALDSYQQLSLHNQDLWVAKA